VLDLVRVIARDLQAERALRLVGRRGRCDLEEPVIVFQTNLLLEFGDITRRQFTPRFAAVAIAQAPLRPLGSVLRAQNGQ